MDEKILSRCGYRCDLCLAYQENIEEDDRRGLLSDGWHKFFGFRIPPSDICCEGCVSSDSTEAGLIDKACPVRQCVIEKEIEDCSECEDYICEKLESRLVSYEELADKYEFEISKDEREMYIRPYENKKRLEEMRE